MIVKETDYAVTRNACKLCTPLGACLALKGIENAMTVLHGSQGCSTYIRRYMISHFKEPIDIASSNFSEDTAVFGGESNLIESIKNVVHSYNPEMIGIATTCLSETIGDDINLILNEMYNRNKDMKFPEFVSISTPSYRGTHINGFHETVLQVTKHFAEEGEKGEHINIFPGMISPADIRHLKEIFKEFGVKAIFMPDYSETLDGGMWTEYQKIPEGGTPISELRKTGRAKGTVEFAGDFHEGLSAGSYLEDKFGVKNYTSSLPIGINLTDKLFDNLKEISGKDMPVRYQKERARLIDSYADGHKYLFGKRAAIYGEEEFVVSMAAFISEIGMVPVLCASGGKSGYMKSKLQELIPDFEEKGIIVKDGMDFVEIDEYSGEIEPEVLIGNSKGYKTSRKYNIPMLRLGFPIHDRFGGQRILHLGYSGTQRLFDELVNIFIELKQEKSEVGYTYI